jgi:2-polyprenyl-3-methyl-5-hydroxy-6-metoxy-1,4-benzoquinol methylase
MKLPNDGNCFAELELKCWCGATAFSQTKHRSYAACNACGTAVIREPSLLTAKATDSVIKETYSEDFWNQRQLDVGLPPIEKRARLDLPERCVYWLKQILHYRLPPGRVLEVGCAHGALVKLLNLAGFRASGMEMDGAIVRKARAWFGIDVIEGPVESLPEDIGMFDVVVMLDVLEHLPQPVDTVRAIVRLLKPDGLLVIQSPEYRINRESSWTNFVAPEHLYLFTQESVCKLLRESGLTNVHFERAIFANDFFLFSSAHPFVSVDALAIEDVLCSTGDGRVILAMLDLWRNSSMNGEYGHLSVSHLKKILKRLPHSLLAQIRRLNVR